MSEDEDTAWQRLDKFLFYARFCKTRSLAADLIEQGIARINRQPVDKPHAKLRRGDILTLALPQSVKVVEVIDLPKRRGSASQMQDFYREIP